MRNWTWRAAFCVGLLLSTGWIGVHLVRDAMRPPPRFVGREGPGSAPATLPWHGWEAKARQVSAHAVVAGRMTRLLQAATPHFKALDARYESYPRDGSRPLLSADSDEEAYCRMVIPAGVDHEALHWSG